MVANLLDRVRADSPLVHCISNYVTANDCVNLLLAAGASAIMADAPQEVEEITALCQGLVLNLGTPSPRRVQAMELAGIQANALGRPVVLDPVGVGCSNYRRETVQRLLTEIRFSAIRGNASEIRTLVEGTAAHRGVDADLDPAADPPALARALALETRAVVVLTGPSDLVTDGVSTFRVHNGDPMMGKITGSGCQLSALLGACLAAQPDAPLEAALTAVCAMGLCGQLARDGMAPLEGNASFRTRLIDAMYHLTGPALKEGANYELL